MVGVLLFKYKITSSSRVHCTSRVLCGDGSARHGELRACARKSQLLTAHGAGVGTEPARPQPCQSGPRTRWEAFGPTSSGSAADSIETAICKTIRRFWV